MNIGWSNLSESHCSNVRFRMVHNSNRTVPHEIIFGMLYGKHNNHTFGENNTSLLFHRLKNK